MKLIRLQAFKEVFEAKTVTEAAYRLKCSQPRVSRLLQELEEEIGFPLFLRERQRLEATAEGKVFYKEIERILVGIEDIDRIADDILLRREVILRILTQSHLSQGLFPQVFNDFEKRYGQVRYYIDVRPRDELAKWLGGHQFDLAFASLPAKHPLVRHQALLSTRLLVALNKEHPLSKQKQITIEDMAKGPIIALKKGTLMRQRLDELTRRAKLTPQIRIEVPSIFLACSLASNGLGITLTDPFVASSFSKEDNLIVRPFAPDYHVDYGAFYLRQNPPRKMARDFIETTRKVASKIVKKMDAVSCGL